MKVRSFLFFLITFFAIAAPVAIYAAGIVPCDGVVGAGGNGVPCDFCALMELAQRLLLWAIKITSSVGAIMFAYAGLLYTTNNGDPGRVSNAHKIFTSVFFGFIIVLVAWLLVDTLIKTLVKESFGPWNKIECASGVTGTVEN